MAGFAFFILKCQFIGTKMSLLITATVECTMHMSTFNLASQSKPQAQHILLDTHAELVCVVVQLTFHHLKVLKKHSQRICRKYFHIPEEKYTSQEEIHKSLFEFQTTSDCLLSDKKMLLVNSVKISEEELLCQQISPGSCHQVCC